MHHRAFGAALAILLTLTPAGSAVAQSGSGPSAAQDSDGAAASEARPIVRLIDAGGEPRHELRYALAVGHTDRFAITTSALSRVQPGQETWPAPMTLLAMAEQTVLGTDGDGIYDLETVYTAIELVSGGGDPMSADIASQLRSYAGTTTHQTVDDRGRVLSVKTTVGPDWAAAGIHLVIMPGLIDVKNLQLSRSLPDEQVGVGAVWQVASEIMDPIDGRYAPPLTVVVTTTLEQLHPDGSFELSSEGRLGAPVQRLTPPNSDHVVLTIHTTGELSARWTVDPTTFGPAGAASVEIVRTTTPTAKGVEPSTIAIRMKTRTERLAAR